MAIHGRCARPRHLPAGGGQLDPGSNGTTRLITRIRSRIRPTPMSVAFAVLIELADFWMIRKMMINLRQRAEVAPSPANHA
jgi:hypothetical protein